MVLHYYLQIESLPPKKALDVVLEFVGMACIALFNISLFDNQELSTYGIFYSIAMGLICFFYIVRGFGKKPYHLLSKTHISIDNSTIKYKPLFHVNQFKIEWKTFRNIQINHEVIVFNTTYNKLKILEFGRLDKDIILEMEHKITEIAQSKGIPMQAA